MTTENKPPEDNIPPEAKDGTDEESILRRRDLIRAGWSVPVVAVVAGLELNPAYAQSPHSDTHGDTPDHVDSPHSDHSDIFPHIDLGHIDIPPPHIDLPHIDLPHFDLPHIDLHTDFGHIDFGL